jgi:hypothetical protein
LNRASAGLETIVARALHRAPPDESALLAWPVVCGSAVAERTRALNFSDGILRVEVSDGGWRRELAKSCASLRGLDQQVFRDCGEAD